MAIPKTYLFVAPEGAPDPVGRGIPFGTIVKGLKKLNSRISVWEQFPDGLWYPGKQSGKTCLWLGPAGCDENTHSVKISAINTGIVPEFTQLGADGRIKMKGWRTIFEKVIKSGAATRAQIEAKFKVDLTIWGEDLLCKPCAKMGRRRAHNQGARKLCRWHEQIANVADQIVEAKKEFNFMQEVAASKGAIVHVNH